MKECDLWVLTVKILEDFFDAGPHRTVSIEQHTADSLASSLDVSVQEQALVQQLTTGVTRFEKLCESALLGFCEYLKRNKTDRMSMYLIAYICIFCFRDLGVTTVRKLFFRSTSTPRVVEYVSFLVNPEAVRTHALPRWKETYNNDFLESTVLSALQSIKDSAECDVIEWLRSKGAGKQEGDDSTAQLSAVRDKNPEVTSPCAAKLRNEQPMTSAPSLAGRSKGLPPAEVREMAFTQPEPRPPQLRRQRASQPNIRATGQKKLPTEPIGFPFLSRVSSVPHTSGSHGTDYKQPEPACHPVPRTDPCKLRDLLHKEVHVPVTAAALLREAANHEKRRTEEERALATMEVALRDTSSLTKWQREQQALEEERRNAMLLQRHLNAIESEERVRQMRKQLEKEKRTAASVERANTTRDVRAVELARLQEELHRRSEASYQKRALEEKRFVAEETRVATNALRAKAVKAENARLKQAAHSAEEERKTEQALVIQEIRMLRERIRQRHANLAERTKGNSSHTPCDRGDDGLHCLSLTELHAEWKRAKEEEKNLEEARRERIRKEHAQRQASRAALAQRCAAERRRLAVDRMEAAAEAAAQEESIQAARTSLETARMMELYTELEEKRQQKRREVLEAKESDRQRRNELLLRAEDKDAMERQRWKQKEDAVVNHLTLHQNRLLADLHYSR